MDREDKSREELLDELACAEQRISDLENKLKHEVDHESIQSLNKTTKFRNVIDASPVPYALNDSEQNIIYVNPALAKRLVMN